MPLTNTKVQNAKPKEKAYKLSDSAGLFLLVNPSGSKLWKIKYRFLMKERQYAAGTFPQVTLAEAREINNQIKKLLADGIDPTQHKRSAKQQQLDAGQNTFEVIARRCLASKKITEDHLERSIRRMQYHVFPRLGSRPISEIKTAEVIRCVEAIDEAGINHTAHVAKRIIQETFRYAMQRELIEANPAGDLKGIIGRQATKPQPCIQPRGISDLLRKMEAYQGEPLTKHALWLITHTFVRTSELILAKWNEVDFARQEWVIPAERMKMRQQHLVPLSRQTLQFFRELHEITGKHDYVLFSPSNQSKHISNNAILSALSRMGYKGLMTGHGFRALASTILNEKGTYNPDAIEYQLSHKERNSVRAAYNRADYLLERKKMMQEWSDYLDFAKAQRATVTQLERRPAIKK